MDEKIDEPRSLEVEINSVENKNHTMNRIFEFDLLSNQKLKVKILMAEEIIKKVRRRFKFIYFFCF